MWTRFMDMHSGGSQKLDWQYIYIEAPIEEARVIFYNRFGRSPDRVTCTCCGEDYSVEQYESLRQATGFDRGCAYKYRRKADGVYVGDDEAFEVGKGIKEGYDDGEYVEEPCTKYSFTTFISFDDWLKNPRGGFRRGSCLLIHAYQIKPEEREGTVPKEGYVWQG